MSDHRMIHNTTEPMHQPWPADMYVQGGQRGVVFRADESHYRTAFVEAFPRDPNTYLRGEGTTVEQAEIACWEKYQRLVSCPAHPQHGPFEAREYTNGAGFCTRCGTWFSSVLPVVPDNPDREPALAERALTGDTRALATILTAMADAEEADRG